MATILRCGLLGYESLTTMITEFRKFNCTTHLLLLVAVCCWVVLLGALFRLTSIKLICGQQNSQLGNNWATNISKKVELGNKKEKEKCTETQQKQALNKQKKVNYFPIQNFPKIVPSISLSCKTSPVIMPSACNAWRISSASKSPGIFCARPSFTFSRCVAQSCKAA